MGVLREGFLHYLQCIHSNSECEEWRSKSGRVAILNAACELKIGLIQWHEGQSGGGFDLLVVSVEFKHRLDRRCLLMREIGSWMSETGSTIRLRQDKQHDFSIIIQCLETSSGGVVSFRLADWGINLVHSRNYLENRLNHYWKVRSSYEKSNWLVLKHPGVFWDRFSSFFAVESV